jgi:hypothetical protein
MLLPEGKEREREAGHFHSLKHVFAYNGYYLREWADAGADNVRAAILIST